MTNIMKTKNIRPAKVILLTFLLFFTLSQTLSANKGLEIAIKSDKNFDGYEDSSSEMTMELISKKGDVCLLYTSPSPRD